jgi:rhodanese-related sulfurtransferase
VKNIGFLSNLFGTLVPKLTATALSEKLKFGKAPLMVDMRQPEEFRQAHISGTKLIPLSELHSGAQNYQWKKDDALIPRPGQFNIL